MRSAVGRQRPVADQCGKCRRSLAAGDLYDRAVFKVCFCHQGDLFKFAERPHQNELTKVFHIGSLKADIWTIAGVRRCEPLSDMAMKEATQNTADIGKREVAEAAEPAATCATLNLGSIV